MPLVSDESSLMTESNSFEMSLFSFNGVTFKKEESSKFPHQRVGALGNYKNSPFVTGDLYSTGVTDGSTNGLKTEILDYGNSKWVQAEDYRFPNSERRYVE